MQIGRAYCRATGLGICGIAIAFAAIAPVGDSDREPAAPARRVRETAGSERHPRRDRVLAAGRRRARSDRHLRRRLRRGRGRGARAGTTSSRRSPANRSPRGGRWAAWPRVVTRCTSPSAPAPQRRAAGGSSRSISAAPPIPRLRRGSTSPTAPRSTSAPSRCTRRRWRPGRSVPDSGPMAEESVSRECPADEAG